MYTNPYEEYCKKHSYQVDRSILYEESDNEKKMRYERQEISFVMCILHITVKIVGH